MRWYFRAVPKISGGGVSNRFAIRLVATFNGLRVVTMLDFFFETVDSNYKENLSKSDAKIMAGFKKYYY